MLLGSFINTNPRKNGQFHSYIIAMHFSDKVEFLLTISFLIEEHKVNTIITQSE